MTTPTAPPPANPSSGRSASLLVPTIGSALLLWAAFPPADLGWLAWVALVPLLTLVRSDRSRAAIYGASWVGGMVFWTLAIQWVRLSDESAWLGWLLMAFALSIFWPLFLALTRVAVLQLRLPLMMAAPIVWIACEYVRAYYFTGFPWYYAAHTQHAFLPVIQVADFAGSLGVSFVILVVNAWLAELLTLPLLGATTRGPRLTREQSVRTAVAASLVFATVVYGGIRLRTADFKDGPRMALLQSSILQRLKMHQDENQLVQTYAGLITRAAHAEDRPDLIVWPETAYPFGIVSIAKGLPVETLEEQVKRLYDGGVSVADWINKRDSVDAHLHGWTDQIGIPMLIGSLTYEHRADGFAKYNSAVLFTPRRPETQAFHKYHLVPFGEYVPLIATFPWLMVLTPYHDGYIPSLNFGRESNLLRVGPYRIATAICFEDTVPQVVRRFFCEVKPGDGPDLLVSLSNDGWFQNSSEHEMHLVASVFRAVEHRVPLARAANTGVSAIIDGNGRVLTSLPTGQEGVVAGAVPLDGRTGLYSVWGDWLGQACLAVTIGLWPLSRLYKPRSRAVRRNAQVAKAV